MAQMAGDYGNKTVIAAPVPAAPAAPQTPVTTVGGVPQVQNPALPQQVVGQNYSPGLSMADIYKDPTILAFLRSSGLSEQVMANEVARRQAAVNQNLALNLEDLGARGQIAQENVSFGAQRAGRHVAGGQALKEAARQQEQQARVQGALQNQAMNQINDLSGSLAMKVAQNQQQAAELGTKTYIDRALTAGQNQIDTNYSSPSASDEEDVYGG